METKNGLLKFYDNEFEFQEIGIDEVGRGPMFGRVYVAAVVLPKNNSNFNYDLLKDSKKFNSFKKIKEVSDYIKKNCINYSIKWSDEKEIDSINIKNATMSAMHSAIKELIFYDKSPKLLLVDGRDFKPYIIVDDSCMIKEIPHICIEGGDNKYCAIAAASILAKVERDEYINELCLNYPNLDIYYNLNKNKGYGTEIHLNGIKQYGISKWHRKTFGICSNSFENNEF